VEEFSGFSSNFRGPRITPIEDRRELRQHFEILENCKPRGASRALGWRLAAYADFTFKA
jgi:hypothetical protein